MAADESVLKRVLPHSIEAEQSVIGSMIMDREAIVVASELISGEDFYNKTETEGLGKLPEGLMLALRRVDGTMLENEERTKAVYNECKNVIEKIKAN